MKKTLSYGLLTLLILLAVYAAGAAASYPITDAILQARAWTFTAILDLTSKGLKTPLKIGTDYTLANPAVAPTGATSATTGTCTTGTNSPYRFYTAWANLSGITNLSPASADVAGTALKRVVVTRSETVPSGATGYLVYWSGTSDAHATKKLCLSGTADSLLVASGTTTYDCSCSASGTAHAGTNQTGLKALTTINTLANNMIGVGTVGTTIGSVLEDVRRLDLSGVTLRYSSDSGANFATVGSMTRVVTICPSGCNYTDLNSACATETSTAALPILYSVGPGTYTGQVSCSGEASAAFVGSGVGVTTLNATGVVGSDGTFKPGTSTNFVVSGMTLKGHRAVHWDGLGVGGGKVLFSDVEFVTEGVAAGFEDCMVYTNLVAGSELRVENYRCSTNEDGITLGDGGANVEVYLKNGTHRCFGPTIGMRMIRFGSTPCRFVAQNLLIDCEMSPAVAQAMTGIIWFGTGTGNCAANAFGHIQGTTIRMKHNGTTGGSSVHAIDVESTASTLTSLHIISGDHAITAVDAVNTDAKGVYVNAAATQTLVVGTLSRVAGGANNTDFQSDAVGALISIVGSDYLSAPDTGRQWSTLRQTPINVAPATCSVGQTYPDASGAFCFCKATNVWEDMTDAVVGVGGCV